MLNLSNAGFISNFIRSACVSLCAALFCTSVSAAAVETTLERAYGYEIGDVFEQVVRIEIGAGNQLDRNSLPKPGRLNAWVDLVSASPSQMNSETHELTLTLRYQLMNSPKDVAVVFLPSLKLKRASANGEVSELVVPAQAISVSPLSKEEAFTRDGMDAMRPDRQVSAISTEPYVHRAKAWFAASLALLGALLALSWQRKRRLARGPFARAAAELKHEHDVSKGYVRLHQAFNESAGRSVFAQNLEQFCIAQPQYAPARVEIEQFYALSRNMFFAENKQASETQFPLNAFAKQLAVIERSHQRSQPTNQQTSVAA